MKEVKVNGKIKKSSFKSHRNDFANINRRKKDEDDDDEEESSYADDEEEEDVGDSEPQNGIDINSQDSSDKSSSDDDSKNLSNVSTCDAYQSTDDSSSCETFANISNKRKLNSVNAINNTKKSKRFLSSHDSEDEVADNSNVDGVNDSEDEVDDEWHEIKRKSNEEIMKWQEIQRKGGAKIAEIKTMNKVLNGKDSVPVALQSILTNIKDVKKLIKLQRVARDLEDVQKKADLSKKSDGIGVVKTIATNLFNHMQSIRDEDQSVQPLRSLLNDAITSSKEIDFLKYMGQNGRAWVDHLISVCCFSKNTIAQLMHRRYKASDKKSETNFELSTLKSSIFDPKSSRKEKGYKREYKVILTTRETTLRNEVIPTSSQSQNSVEETPTSSQSQNSVASREEDDFKFTPQLDEESDIEEIDALVGTTKRKKDSLGPPESFDLNNKTWRRNTSNWLRLAVQIPEKEGKTGWDIMIEKSCTLHDMYSSGLVSVDKCYPKRIREKKKRQKEKGKKEREKERKRMTSNNPEDEFDDFQYKTFRIYADFCQFYFYRWGASATRTSHEIFFERLLHSTQELVKKKLATGRVRVEEELFPFQRNSLHLRQFFEKQIDDNKMVRFRWDGKYYWDELPIGHTGKKHCNSYLISAIENTQFSVYLLAPTLRRVTTAYKQACIARGLIGEKCRNISSENKQSHDNVLETEVSNQTASSDDASAVQTEILERNKVKRSSCKANDQLRQNPKAVASQEALEVKQTQMYIYVIFEAWQSHGHMKVGECLRKPGEANMNEYLKTRYQTTLGLPSDTNMRSFCVYNDDEQFSKRQLFTNYFDEFWKHMKAARANEGYLYKWIDEHSSIIDTSCLVLLYLHFFSRASVDRIKQVQKHLLEVDYFRIFWEKYVIQFSKGEITVQDINKVMMDTDNNVKTDFALVNIDYDSQIEFEGVNAPPDQRGSYINAPQSVADPISKDLYVQSEIELPIDHDMCPSNNEESVLPQNHDSLNDNEDREDYGIMNYVDQTIHEKELIHNIIRSMCRHLRDDNCKTAENDDLLYVTFFNTGTCLGTENLFVGARCPHGNTPKHPAYYFMRHDKSILRIDPPVMRKEKLNIILQPHDTDGIQLASILYLNYHDEPSRISDIYIYIHDLLVSSLKWLIKQIHVCISDINVIIDDLANIHTNYGFHQIIYWNEEINFVKKCLKWLGTQKTTVYFQSANEQDEKTEEVFKKFWAPNNTTKKKMSNFKVSNKSTKFYSVELNETSIDATFKLNSKKQTYQTKQVTYKGNNNNSTKNAPKISEAQEVKSLIDKMKDKSNMFLINHLQRLSEYLVDLEAQSTQETSNENCNMYNSQQLREGVGKLLLQLHTELSALVTNTLKTLDPPNQNREEYEAVMKLNWLIIEVVKIQEKNARAEGFLAADCVLSCIRNDVKLARFVTDNDLTTSNLQGKAEWLVKVRDLMLRKQNDILSTFYEAFQTIIKNSIENLGNFNEQANLAQLVKQNNEKKSRARLCKARMQALVTYAKSQLKSSKKPIPGLVGFKNYSASCYINACLQLFLHSGLNKQFFDRLATEGATQFSKEMGALLTHMLPDSDYVLPMAPYPFSVIDAAGELFKEKSDQTREFEDVQKPAGEFLKHAIESCTELKSRIDIIELKVKSEERVIDIGKGVSKQLDSREKDKSVLVLQLICHKPEKFNLVAPPLSLGDYKMVGMLIHVGHATLAAGHFFAAVKLSKSLSAEFCGISQETLDELRRLEKEVEEFKKHDNESAQQQDEYDIVSRKPSKSEEQRKAEKRIASINHKLGKFDRNNNLDYIRFDDDKKLTVISMQDINDDDSYRVDSIMYSKLVDDYIDSTT